MIILKANKLLFKNFSAFLALGFGSGLITKAPGTFGTLVAIPIFLFLQFLSQSLIYLFIITMFFIGIYVADKTSQALAIKDPSCIVIDEIVGFLLLLVLVVHVPGTEISITKIDYILAFILFRIFDIWKPFPIDFLEKKFKGGFGIMIDDVGAAIYAYIIFILIHYAI
ncbi:phosphatidylglycerophosphatase A [Methylophilaceae bacterium]|jgi:phosphatidylglycerophosphatase A|nr:phosphatidylglycerophosphatase A [Methylophilaceae bacterium]|tara:strand:+ start:749 stop:1252 length:504 start_codon:yes stop_codon:yes gene_type:complete